MPPGSCKRTPVRRSWPLSSRMAEPFGTTEGGAPERNYGGIYNTYIIYIYNLYIYISLYIRVCDSDNLCRELTSGKKTKKHHPRERVPPNLHSGSRAFVPSAHLHFFMYFLHDLNPYSRHIKTWLKEMLDTRQSESGGNRWNILSRLPGGLAEGFWMDWFLAMLREDALISHSCSSIPPGVASGWGSSMESSFWWREAGFDSHSRFFVPWFDSLRNFAGNWEATKI